MMDSKLYNAVTEKFVNTQILHLWFDMEDLNNSNMINVAISLDYPCPCIDSFL